MGLEDGLSGVGELGLGIGHGLDMGLGGVGELGLGVDGGSSCVLNCTGGATGNRQNGQEGCDLQRIGIRVSFEGSDFDIDFCILFEP